MKKIILSLVSVLLVASGFLEANSAKVAVIDKERVFKDYSLVKEAYKEVYDLEQGTYRIINTAEKEMKDFEEKGKKPEEIEKKRKEIQAIIDAEITKLHNTKETYNEKINTNIQNALEKFAKANSYDLIIDKAFYISGAEEITNEFLLALEKEKK